MSSKKRKNGQNSPPSGPQRRPDPVTVHTAPAAQSGRPGEPPHRPPLTKAQKKERERQIRQRIKEKRKQAKAEAKQKKRREKELAKRRAKIAQQRKKQRAQEAVQTPGGLPNGLTPQRVTRSEARRRRRRRAIITICLTVLFIAAGFLLSVTVLFKIGGFRVEGDCIYTQEELIEAFGHPAGENMFQFKIAEAEAQMAEKLPYLETIKVRRSLPSTVVFLVTAAQEKYAIDTGSGVLVLSESLKILKNTDTVPEGLCRLEGMTPQSKVTGRTLTTGDATSDTLIETVLTAITDSGLQQVTAVDFSDPYEISLKYADRITVRLGTKAQLDYKLAMVEKTLEDSYFTDSTTGTLDASDAGKTVFKQG